MFRARHPHDDRLFDNYATARRGEAVDPIVAEHLADCASCAARYAQLTRFMDGLASEAEAESDAIFTTDRLRNQQQQILRRIEHVGRSARVISFPRHGANERVAPASPHVPSRWIASAAAAGLFIGVAMGATLGWRSPREQPRPMAAAGRTAPAHLAANPATPPTAEPTTQVATATRPDATTAPAAEPADDAFLSDLESMLERSQTRELRAIDVFTPHVREVREVRYLR